MKTRQDVRVRPPGRTIAWCPFGESRLRTASIENESRTGVLMRPHSNDNVSHGDVLRTSTETGEDRYARVVRLENGSSSAGGSMCVACRWLRRTSSSDLAPRRHRPSRHHRTQRAARAV